MTSKEDSKHELINLSSKLDIIIEGMKYQDMEILEIKTSVNKLSDVVIDPEKGLYSKVKILEVWKASTTRFFWIVLTALVGVGGTACLWYLKN